MTVGFWRPVAVGSGQRLQPLAIQKIEQLERRAAGMLLADFPLAHGGQARVEHRCRNGLAEVVAFPQGADLRAGVLRDRLEERSSWGNGPRGGCLHRQGDFLLDAELVIVEHVLRAEEPVAAVR